MRTITKPVRTYIILFLHIIFFHRVLTQVRVRTNRAHLELEIPVFNATGDLITALSSARATFSTLRQDSSAPALILNYNYDKKKTEFYHSVLFGAQLESVLPKIIFDHVSTHMLLSRFNEFAKNITHVYTGLYDVVEKPAVRIT